MRPEEFACTIGFDAFRISMGGKPRHHDVETICRWLRHVSAQGTEAEGRNTEGGSVHEGPVSEADAPSPLPHPQAPNTLSEVETIVGIPQLVKRGDAWSVLDEAGGRYRLVPEDPAALRASQEQDSEVRP